MAQYTKTEIESLDLISEWGAYGNASGNSTFTMDDLDLIGPWGPFWSIVASGGVVPPAFDATKMFLCF